MTNITPAQAANEIIAALTTKVDVSELVANAQARLGVKAPVKRNEVEATDPAIMNELLARQDELAEIEKRAREAREGIKTIIRNYMGKADVLKVNGAVVATNAASKTSRVLNQEWIKATYPDIPGNENFWKDQGGSRSLRFK